MANTREALAKYSQVVTTLTNKPIENIVGKKENAGYLHLFLSPCVFSSIRDIALFQPSNNNCLHMLSNFGDKSTILPSGKKN